MNEEIWRPVVGFEDYYEVSNQGRVRSLARVCRHCHGRTRRVKPRVLKPSHTGGSRGGVGLHTKVCLAVDTVKTQRQVHILVLEAFVGLRPQGYETRHLNGIPDDNRLINVCWGTPEENRADIHRHGRFVRGVDRAQAKLDASSVITIRADYLAGVGVNALARRYGVARATIQQVLKGKTWTHV
jgi:hypothetical protein